MVQHGDRFLGERLAQRQHDLRLADSGLAGKQHHLSLPRLGPSPAIKKQRQLRITPDDRRQFLDMKRLEAARRATGSEHTKRSNRDR